MSTFSHEATRVYVKISELIGLINLGCRCVNEFLDPPTFALVRKFLDILKTRFEPNRGICFNNNQNCDRTTCEKAKKYAYALFPSECHTSSNSLSSEHKIHSTSQQRTTNTTYNVPILKPTIENMTVS